MLLTYIENYVFDTDKDFTDQSDQINIFKNVENSQKSPQNRLKCPKEPKYVKNS